MSRGPRTTKRQKEFIINYLEEHTILLGGKINPMQLSTLNKIWEELTFHLNQIGPAKTVRQWKDSISEMKTSVRRHAREIKYGHTGTGGGSAVKPLTDFEERMLSLISSLTIEGADLMEAGGAITVLNESEITASTSNEYYVEETSSFGNDPPAVESNIVFQQSDENEVIEEIIVEENVFNTSNMEESVLKENRPNKIAENRREIKRRPLRRSGNRVLTALDVHDKNLHALSKSNYAIAKSMNNLAKSINNLSRKWK